MLENLKEKFIRKGQGSEWAITPKTQYFAQVIGLDVHYSGIK
jgi:hypothetical protein